LTETSDVKQYTYSPPRPQLSPRSRSSHAAYNVPTCTHVQQGVEPIVCLCSRHDAVIVPYNRPTQDLSLSSDMQTGCRGIMGGDSCQNGYCRQPFDPSGLLRGPLPGAELLLAAQQQQQQSHKDNLDQKLSNKSIFRGYCNGDCVMSGVSETCVNRAAVCGCYQPCLARSGYTCTPLCNRFTYGAKCKIPQHQSLASRYSLIEPPEYNDCFKEGSEADDINQCATVPPSGEEKAIEIL